MKPQESGSETLKELSHSERDAFRRWLGIFSPLLLALLAYGLAAVLLFRNLDHFEGDEPHYVVMAGSLCRDGDANLANDYRTQDYRSYYPHVDFEPHALDYQGNGELRSVHSIGLPILLLLPECVLGHPYWARLEMAALAALASWSIFLTLRDWTNRPRLAYATWAAMTFTMPLWAFAPQIYPDVVAVLGVALALQLFLARPVTPVKILGIGLVVALLPWLHARFAVLGLLIAATTVVELIQARTSWKTFLFLLFPPAISGLLWLWNSYVWYGGIMPSAGYRPWFQHVGSFSWDKVYLSLTSLFVGREFGLVTYSPIYLLALVGLVMMVLHREKTLIAPLIWLLGYVLAVVLSQAVYRIDQGYSFPARMLLPVTPLLAIPLAYSIWHTRWLRIVGLALFLISVTMAVQSLLQPYAAFANQNGISELPLLRPVQGIFPALRYVGQSAELDLSRTDRQTGKWTYNQLTDVQIVLAEPQLDEPGFMVFGRRLAFRTGQYTASITLRSGEADPTAVVAHIDIATDEGRRVLAARDVYAHEFSDGAKPQAFSLSFSTRDTWPIEARVYYTGQSRLWVQSISITSQAELRTISYPSLPIAVGWCLLVIMAGLLAARRTRSTGMEPDFDA